MHDIRENRSHRSFPHLRRCIAAPLLAVALCIAALPAGAQQASMQAAIERSLSRPAPATATSSLGFSVDPAVAARERDRMLEMLRAAGGTESGLSQSIESGKLLQTFDRLLKRHGYSPRDLGDVLAAYLVLAWEVVNDADATRQPEGMRAVRRQLGPALASVPQVSGMGDGERQAQAQRTAYMAMVATLQRQAFKANGNAGRLATLQADVRRQVQSSAGIDLREYTLTAGGLAPR